MALISGFLRQQRYSWIWHDILSCISEQVYVWGRRNPYVTLSFLGIFNFTAPYLPWVLLGFSVLLRSSPVVDLLGMAVGGIPILIAHKYFAFNYSLWHFPPTMSLRQCNSCSLPSTQQTYLSSESSVHMWEFACSVTLISTTWPAMRKSKQSFLSVWVQQYFRTSVLLSRGRLPSDIREKAAEDAWYPSTTLSWWWTNTASAERTSTACKSTCRATATRRWWRTQCSPTIPGAVVQNLAMTTL